METLRPAVVWEQKNHGGWHRTTGVPVVAAGRHPYPFFWHSACHGIKLR
jgi:hypothetical protein